jgi:hypothetical protein
LSQRETTKVTIMNTCTHTNLNQYKIIRTPGGDHENS